jgi:hypothetical protein
LIAKYHFRTFTYEPRECPGAGGSGFDTQDAAKEAELQILGEFLFYLLVELLAYWTGRLFLPLLSLGWVRAGGLADMPELKIERRNDGTRILGASLVQAARILVWALVGLAAVLGYRWT